MGCGCSKRGEKAQFAWYDPSQPESVKPTVHNSQIEARAKVMRAGGRYIPYDGSMPVDAAVAQAEAARSASA